MIPALAVEAAAKAAYEFRFSGFRSWADLSEYEKSEAISEQRFALEAAAPHMLAALRPYTIEDQRKHGETW